MNKKVLLALGIAAVVVYVKRDSIFGKKATDANQDLADTPSAGSNGRWLTDEEAQRYLNTYKDLSDAYGTDLELAKWHFQNFGYLENRIF